jgi:hypothetical protein
MGGCGSDELVDAGDVDRPRRFQPARRLIRGRHERRGVDRPQKPAGVFVAALGGEVELRVRFDKQGLLAGAPASGLLLRAAAS